MPLQLKVLDIESAYKAERVALEKKYFAQRQEIYEKRSEIINGVVEVEAEVAVENDDGMRFFVILCCFLTLLMPDTKNIPGFWAAAISNHSTVGSLVSEEDMPALEAITDITCEYNDDWSGFTLTFKFADNKYFTNKVYIC